MREQKMYVQFLDFENNHILNEILKTHSFIQYPLSENHKRDYNLQYIHHYYELDLFKLGFKNKIYYVVNQPEKTIRIVNHYLRKKYKENMAVFKCLKREIDNFNGDQTDSEYDILQKRYNSARQLVIEHKYWSEPFEAVEFPVPLDELVPNRILIK